MKRFQFVRRIGDGAKKINNALNPVAKKRRLREKAVLETLGGEYGNLPGDLKVAMEKHNIKENELEKMLKKGLIEKHKDIPGVSIYSMTNKGRDHYLKWLKEIGKKKGGKNAQETA
ncbi:MAG: hypothetical protein ABH854_01205 [Candidatus Diapherotrites archaeon]|nr:hypothetical protein [Candidatus Micrarchaeota archaeon]MBU1939593.1 hypothetical protein [Candidatus Micrarchaeota archaeon]